MRKITQLAALGSLLTLPLLSGAAQVDDTFQVRINLQASCTIDGTTDMDFGDATEAEVIAGTVAEATSTVDVTCSNGAAYTVGMDNGANFGSGTAGQRAMKSANSSFISYNLYQSTGTSTPWGDIGSGDELSDTGDGTSKTLTIFGTVPAQTPTIDPADNITSGGVALTDTVTVTVDF